ncbi:MAG: hypothetical protein WBP83_09860, partial [Nitrososphaeraceae archaeon]
SKKEGYKYFICIIITWGECLQVKRLSKNKNSREMTQANSKLDFSSRVINSLYKFHEFIMN